MSDISDVQNNPSDVLMVLASAMSRSNPFDHQKLKDQFYDMGPKVDISVPDEWFIRGAVLCEQIRGSLGSWPPPPPESPEQFVQYAAALQRLDRWHTPLLPSRTDLQRLPEHEGILDNFALNGKFNTNIELGSIIPRRSFSDVGLVLEKTNLDFDAEPTVSKIICLLLDNCYFLPALIPAGDPDADSSSVSARSINFTYERIQITSFLSFKPRSQLRIATAPVLEIGRDAKFEEEGGRYFIMPSVPVDRIGKILRSALDKGADVLLLPEAAVDEESISALQNLLKELRRDRVDNNTSTWFSLRLLLVGAIANTNSVKKRNYVVALDGNGNILFEQDKLSRWNLNRATQLRFGQNTSSDLLEENIEPGKSINVVDFEGIGRLMVLICADMSHDMPGDHIADCVDIDMLYAPIMDASICSRKEKNSWIISRAVRFCSRSGTTVMVTNSMVMACWNNAANVERKSRDNSFPFESDERCGVNFFLRRGVGGMQAHNDCVDIGSAPPIIRFIEMSEDWALWQPN